MSTGLPLGDTQESDRPNFFRTLGASYGLSSQSPFSEVWKKEKVCFLCQEKVGTGRGDTKKRKGCRFCLHALCEKCAPIKAMHPQTHQNERICVNCFKSTIEQSIRDEVSSELSSKNQELRALEEQLSAEIDSKISLQSQLKSLEQELSSIRGDNPVPSDFHSQLLSESMRADNIEREFSTLQGDFMHLQREMQLERQTYETNLELERQNAAKARKTLIFQTAQLAGLKGTNETLRKHVEDLEKQLSGDSGKEEVLRKTKEIHAAEKLELQKQLFAANEMVKTKNEEVERLNAACKDAVLRLKHKDSEMMGKIKGLEEEKRQLEEEKKRFVVSENEKEWKKQVEALKNEIMELKSQLAERESLLSLAKEDIIEENSRRLDLEEHLKLDIETDMSRLKSELMCKIEQWKLYQEEVRGVLLSLPSQELMERQRGEVEQYKQQLGNCHSTIMKFDEVFKVVQEKLQLEQQVIGEKEREVEALKQILESHGITIPQTVTDTESGTALNMKLKEREETIERLNEQMMQYKEEMRKLKNEKFRRSRPSGNGKSATLKPPLSQDPCDCRVF